MAAIHRRAPFVARVATLALSVLLLTFGLAGGAGAEEKPAGSQLDASMGTTIRLAGGGTEWFIDPQVVKEARMQIQGAGFPKCGPACDGKDPNSYLVRGYVGQIGWTSWYCTEGAYTVYKYHPSPYAGDPYVELRWSPKCETSWARGCCYTRYMLRGFYSATGGERSRTYG